MNHYNHVVINTDAIIPYENNARVHSEHQVDQIKNSIVEFGFTNPILIDEHNNLIAGHGRLMAASELGMTAVPAMVITDLDENKRRALVLADNKLAMNASWDEQKLIAELGDLAQDYGELMGFSGEELVRLLTPKDQPFGELDDDEEDDITRPPKKTDDDYAAFEVVMLYDNKVRFMKAINKIKADNDIASTEHAMMTMCEAYVPN